MSEIIVVRTNHYDLLLDQFIEKLSSQTDRRIVIAADETKQSVPSPSQFTKVTIDPRHMGLHTTDDMMWRCGDYALYAALEAITDASFFWMIEPDIRIHAADLKPIFDGINGSAGIDFITPWFVAASPEWAWYSSMKPYSRQIYNCMIQICRMSRKSLDFLLQRRLELGRYFTQTQKWPNDEAFIGATLKDGGFSVTTLKEHAPDFEVSGTLTFTKPTSANWLKTQAFDQHVYHPVVSGQKFLQRAKAYLEERERCVGSTVELLKEFNNSFINQVQLEAGAQAARDFYNDVQKSLGRLQRARSH
jgi:hypothetical protein